MKSELVKLYRTNGDFVDEGETMLAICMKHRANLSRAYLSGANLSGAYLSGAYLSGANLSGANGIHGYFCFGPGGSRLSYTWSRWEAMGYMVHCGCQTLTLAAFTKRVKEKHGTTYHAKWYAENIATMKLVAKASKAAFEASEKAKGGDK